LWKLPTIQAKETYNSESHVANELHDIHSSSKKSNLHDENQPTSDTRSDPASALKQLSLFQSLTDQYFSKKECPVLGIFDGNNDVNLYVSNQ